MVKSKTNAMLTITSFANSRKRNQLDRQIVNRQIHTFSRSSIYNLNSTILLSVCLHGYFGQDCAYTCNNTCKGCNNTNGLCDSGCNPGWKGDYCNEGIVLQNRKKGFLCLHWFFFKSTTIRVLQQLYHQSSIENHININNV